MTEGGPAEKESAPTPEHRTEPESLSTTAKRAYAALPTFCGLLAAIAVFIAAYGKSGTTLLAVTVVTFVVLVIIAIIIFVLAQYRSKRVTARFWILAIAFAFAVLIGAGSGYGVSRVLSNPPPSPTASAATPVTSPSLAVSPSASVTSSPSPSAPTPESSSAEPTTTTTAPQPPTTMCNKGTDTVVVIPTGGTTFNVQVEVCTPAPAGHHYWLMSVLPDQGESRTTNYYPLGDVATLPTMTDTSGRQVPYFPSTVPAVNSGRCWEVLAAPDSMQTDLINQSNARPRVAIYTQGSRPPAGLAAASTCVSEPE